MWQVVCGCRHEGPNTAGEFYNKLSNAINKCLKSIDKSNKEWHEWSESKRKKIEAKDWESLYGEDFVPKSPHYEVYEWVEADSDLKENFQTDYLWIQNNKTVWVPEIFYYNHIDIDNIEKMNNGLTRATTENGTVIFNHVAARNIVNMNDHISWHDYMYIQEVKTED